jgi:hypothetical protein
VGRIAAARPGHILAEGEPPSTGLPDGLVGDDRYRPIADIRCVGKTALWRIPSAA